MIGQGFVGGDGLARTRSGIILPPKPNARAWVKIAGEAALIFYEDPPTVIERWVAFTKNPEQGYLILHDNQFGTPVFLTRNAIDQLAFISITHPTTEQARTVPGSIYSGTCPCGSFGGTCPPVEKSEQRSAEP